jgi:hypothetical protein
MTRPISISSLEDTMQPAIPLWITISIVATTIAVPAIAWLALRKVARRAAPSIIVPAFTFLALWLVVAFELAARGFFVGSGRGSFPPIGWALAPVVIGYLGYLTLRTARTAIDQIPLQWMIGLQVYRALGVVFLVEWMLGALPGAFALPAGIGDVLIGLTAPFIAARVRDGAPGAREAAIRWNVLGIADLVVAVTMGVLTTPGPLHLAALGPSNVGLIAFPLVLIPTIGVPFAILLHLIGLHRLTARAGQVRLGLSKAA